MPVRSKREVVANVAIAASTSLPITANNLGLQSNRAASRSPNSAGGHMDASSAADLFQRWAINEGLMANSVSGGPPTITRADTALISPISDAGRNLLRSKQVQAVAFNDVVPAIIVLFKR